MQTRPLPILVLSVEAQPTQSENIFRMLSAGAIDVVAKPRNGIKDVDNLLAKDLTQRIAYLASLGRNGAGINSGRFGGVIQAFTCADPSPAIFGIGSSTGGPQALEAIVSRLPSNFPVPIVCVQHISPGFIAGMASWLNGISALPVEVARPGQQVQAGHLYLAPDGGNLEIDPGGVCRVSPLQDGDERFPSIDKLFRSIASSYGKASAGIILSGMGMDGVLGMRAIRYAGGTTIAQDEESSIVFSMPRASIESTATQYVLPVDCIAEKMVLLTGGPSA